MNTGPGRCDVPGRPFRCVADGVTVSVRLTPKAKKPGFNGTQAQADGMALKVGVTEAPERNRANNALLALLSRAWRIPKSALRVDSGQTSRNKLVHIAGDPDQLNETLCDWMTTQHD